MVIGNGKTLNTMKAMKRIMRFFSIAALAAAVTTMVGCTKEEMNNANGLTFTTTVQLPTGGKAIDEMGHKTFAVGETIKLNIYGTGDGAGPHTSNPLTSADISADGKAARFTFTFASAPALPEGRYLQYDYPGVYQGISYQYGTLEGLSTEFDYATTGFIQVTTAGQLPSNIRLRNQYAVLKLKILNSENTDITHGIDNLTVNIPDEENGGIMEIFVGRGAAELGDAPFYSHGDSPIYVAVPGITEEDIVFTTGDYSDYYDCTRTKTVNSKTLQTGHLYPVELTMSPATVTWKTPIVDGTAGSGYGINAQSYNMEYSGASFGGIQLRTTYHASWYSGTISDGGEGGSIFFNSAYGKITRIVMTDFTMTGGELSPGWTQDGTTFTWSGDPANIVYLVGGTSLNLTAGASAQIVFTVE